MAGVRFEDVDLLGALSRIVDAEVLEQNGIRVVSERTRTTRTLSILCLPCDGSDGSDGKN